MIYTQPGSFDSEDSATHSITPGEWRQGQQPQGMLSLECRGSNRSSQGAREVREHGKSVSWQKNMI